MNKIGLKLWNINTDYYFEEAKRLYIENVFDYIELYIVPGHLDKIDKWTELNIPFDIHAPHSAHGMNLSKKELFDNNYQLYLETKQYADVLGAEIIVFHGGVDGTIEQTIEQLSSFNDRRILIENKPYKVMPFIQGKRYVGTIPTDIILTMNQTGYGFCFDVCHALCVEKSLGMKPYSLCSEFVKLNPLRVHLSDHKLSEELDSHLNYGKGQIDFSYILKQLPKNIAITIETQKACSTNLDDFISDVNFLKAKIMDLTI